MSNNRNMVKARSVRNDEFYTRYVDVDKELSSYNVEVFRGKIIYLPADKWDTKGTVPQSNFIRWFLDNKELIGFDKLVATCISVDEEYNYYEVANIGGIYHEYYYRCVQDEEFTSGDFRSKFCKDILCNCDIVVTNPPFSLFLEFIDLVMSYNKQIITLGNSTSVLTNQVFEYLKTGKLILSDTIRSHGLDFEIGDEFGSVKNVGVRWYTTIQKNNFKHKDVEFIKRDLSNYEFYDNSDILYVGGINEIPDDYWGYMALPISIFDRKYKNKLELIDSYIGSVDGEKKFARIICKRVR